MDHAYFKDKISAYFDGALEAQEREMIRRHLEDCSECRAFLEELKHLSSTIEKHSGLAGDEYFEQLAQKIESRIATPREKVVDVRQFRWTKVIWKFSAAAASILLVGTIGYYQWFQDDELPARVLESSQPPAMSEQVTIDSVSNNEMDELRGREKSDAVVGGYVSEAEVPGEIAKNEGGAKKVVRAAPDSRAIVAQPKTKENQAMPQAVVADSFRDDNAAEESVNAPAESQEAAGKMSAGQSGADEVRARQESLSKVIPEDSDSPASGLAQLEELNLDDLRKQNFYLQSQVVQNKDGAQYMNNFQDKKPAKTSLKAVVEAKVPDSIYQQLAVSWYQIGQITTDSLEKSQAREYLNWYKTNFPADSALVKQYLKEIAQ